MLKTTLLLSAVLLGISGYVFAEKAEEAATSGYAFDANTAIPQASFNCLRSEDYVVAFLRGYKPNLNGGFDSTVVQNTKFANAENIGVEVYMSPNPSSGKTAAQQFNEFYNGLTANFSVQAVWLQVTNPILWSPTIQNNVEFINAIVYAAKSKGLAIGIYTNQYDWSQITNNWTSMGVNLLWYWNVLGSGEDSETSNDFSDFHAFGPFKTPSAKQFGQGVEACNVTLNRDVVAFSSTSRLSGNKVDPARPTIGGFF
ncbi:hypothetical protein Q1695_012483 [Nippostrongylus brasiliensis]|nr:hypothetical protein Q1695_012483 [Nippostrongylus brasiliensis]